MNLTLCKLAIIFYCLGTGLYRADHMLMLFACNDAPSKVMLKVLMIGHNGRIDNIMVRKNA